jgi:hypothetical protein
MKSLVKRLGALEGVQGSAYAHWSDAELIDRMNELSLQLRPYGLAFPLLDGGPDDVDRLRVAQQMLAKEMLDGVVQTAY